MRILPTELGSEITSSERRVHAAIASSNIPGVALHSLNLPEHEHKLTSELDFVLILDELILAIEVKGGRVSQRGGLWVYSDRAGHYRESHEGPFKQVADGMYALRDRLRGRLRGEAVRRLAFGFLVVTPDIDLATSFEWADETYCGRGPFSRGLDTAIMRATRYWLRRQPDGQAIDAHLRATLINDLRPEFDRSPLLEARAAALDAAFVRLTDEQFSRLDLVSDAPRVLCSGGAGTGKTLLAAEIARRRAAAGENVVFTCRSEILAANVRGMLAGAGVRVHAAGDLPLNEPCGMLVVDEAQDLMNYAHLDALEKTVDGGLSGGRWVMFMDHNRQTHLYGDFDQTALEFVRSLGAVPATLRANCRNTREIAFQTRALTGADVGVSAAGSGPEVEFVTVEDRDVETRALEAHLRRLREEEVLPGHITLVSMRGDWDTSSARELRAARRGRIRRLEVDNADKWPSDDLTWASSKAIKGLENRFICVIDIDTLETDVDLDLLYVALSRARTGLWIASSRAISTRIAELYATNAVDALEALKGTNQ
ncbi:nuclease-related domain-containing DEAD/DEAH box helicase [Mycolicibacterium monacense]|uniref:nuclease-related domain-containing DEAD/DEAH box helicase n=1 Tax=Mycolicibacterium monacense TaxID=85693 RepID=UPI0007EC20B9|nr:NERD domain-containing protein/DEAD/DEAH box helicase [Mycolicibacterium monacense]OBB67098.1 hypothetical protein A6B34_20630 [Mycolicibacterium monacense]